MQRAKTQPRKAQAQAQAQDQAKAQAQARAAVCLHTPQLHCSFSVLSVESLFASSPCADSCLVHILVVHVAGGGAGEVGGDDGRAPAAGGHADGAQGAGAEAEPPARAGAAEARRDHAHAGQRGGAGRRHRRRRLRLVGLGQRAGLLGGGGVHVIVLFV